METASSLEEHAIVQGINCLLLAEEDVLRPRHRQCGVCYDFLRTNTIPQIFLIHSPIIRRTDGRTMGLLEAVVLEVPVSTHSNSKTNYARSNGN